MLVNTESSQLWRPRRITMPSEQKTSRTCCVCKKIFCCVQCREKHEKNKHTNIQPNCPLCISKKLPLKQVEDKALFCHIAIAHLPLYCCLCGEIFKQEKDLESFGACKWWKLRHHHSLVSEQKSILSTPPLILDGEEYNGNLGTFTSPPELYRNTSTPMFLGQNNKLEFKTPVAPNFSLKTPKTNSASLKTDQTNNLLQDNNSKTDNSSSKYMSFPSQTSQTPFRNLPLNRGNKDRILDITKNQNKYSLNECYMDNHCVEDMELTNIQGDILPDSQGLEAYQPEKRSDSMKKVRFSDQYECEPEPSSTNNFNMTENEEYFEACDMLPDEKHSLEPSQIKIYEDNVKNMEKENRNPDGLNINNSQSTTGNSRMVMMVIVENNSAISTSDLIDTGLKRLEHVTSKTNFSINSPGCSSSLTSLDSYYSISSNNNSPLHEFSPASRSSNTSTDTSCDSNNTGGIFSAVANAVRNVMKNLSGGRSSKNIQREQISSRPDIVPTPSTSQRVPSASILASSILQRPGKRPRDTSESTSSSYRSVDHVSSQLELRSPVAKRQRGWYNVKAREPIARMRNNRQITSPRGVSSETQVFHQGSLSVGDTVLPLPDRAHQSTQTE